MSDPKSSSSSSSFSSFSTTTSTTSSLCTTTTTTSYMIPSKYPKFKIVVHGSKKKPTKPKKCRETRKKLILKAFELFEQGYSIRYVSKIINMPRTTVHRNIKKLLSQKQEQKKEIKMESRKENKEEEIVPLEELSNDCQFKIEESKRKILEDIIDEEDEDEDDQSENVKNNNNTNEDDSEEKLQMETQIEMQSYEIRYGELSPQNDSWMEFLNFQEIKKSVSEEEFEKEKEKIKKEMNEEKSEENLDWIEEVNEWLKNEIDRNEMDLSTLQHDYLQLHLQSQEKNENVSHFKFNP